MTKTHALVDGNGLPLVIALTPGQANDSPALPRLLAELSVPRVGPGRPRTRPDSLRADKAYSARAHRTHLRARGITAVIPEPSDQIAHRIRKGSHGGRPVNFDARDCGRSRNSRWLRSRNSAVGGSVLMFYSLAPFGVEVGRPGRLFGR